MRNRNKLLDSMKGIACLMIVFRHVELPGVCGEIMYAMARFAVPLFMLTTGYFTYNVDNAVIKQRAVRLLRLFLISFTVYVVFRAGLAFAFGSEMTWFNKLSNWQTGIRAILLFDFDVFFCWHLWYLPAIIFSYITLMIIDKRGYIVRAYVMIPFLFLLRMGVVFLNDLDLLDWHYSCIYLISAFPWFLLGNLISSVQNRIKVSDSVLLLTSAAGIMLEVLLVFLKLNSVFSEAVTIILTTALFVIAVRHPGFSLGRVIERIGHSYSVFVYIFHVLIAGIITVAAVKTNVANEEWVWWSRPFITIMICLLIGRLTKRNSKRAVS